MHTAKDHRRKTRLRSSDGALLYTCRVHLELRRPVEAEFCSAICYDPLAAACCDCYSTHPVARLLPVCVQCPPGCPAGRACPVSASAQLHPSACLPTERLRHHLLCTRHLSALRCGINMQLQQPTMSSSSSSAAAAPAEAQL